VGLRSSQSLATLAVCSALGAVLYGRWLPDVAISASVCAALRMPRCRLTCQDIAGGMPSVLMLVGRLPQIIANFKQGHAGQLALLTYALNTLGGMARVFTTIQQLDDPIALFSVISGLAQNTVLLLQILILGCAPSTTASLAVKGQEKKTT